MSESKFSLAREFDVYLLTAMLMLSGSQCGACGHGTRVTSKRWAKCKNCGGRVQRRTLDEAGKILRGEQKSAQAS